MPQEHIDARKKSCLMHLSMKIAPFLLRGPVRIFVDETIDHVSDFGIPRVVYTLHATIERV